MIQKNLELKHSEHYHRTRRNYIFAAALLIVLSFADPTSIKIPGFGDDAVLPPALAYGALWLATLLFGWEFSVEHAVTKARNQEALSDADDDLSRGIAKRISELEELTAQISDFDWPDHVRRSLDNFSKSVLTLPALAEGSINTALKNFERLVRSSPSEEGSSAEKILADVAGYKSAVVSLIEGSMKDSYERWQADILYKRQTIISLEEQVAEKLPALLAALQDDSLQIKRFNDGFGAISGSIHRQQRVAFWIKDTALSWLLLIAATVGAFYHVPEAFGYRWRWEEARSAPARAGIATDCCADTKK